MFASFAGWIRQYRTEFYVIGPAVAQEALNEMVTDFEDYCFLSESPDDIIALCKQPGWKTEKIVKSGKVPEHYLLTLRSGTKHRLFFCSLREALNQYEWAHEAVAKRYKTNEIIDPFTGLFGLVNGKKYKVDPTLIW
jgi:hypothetical protein